MTTNVHHRYFSQSQNALLRWDEDGSAICWDNGLTIAFREELADVVRHLAPHCVPAMNGVVVLLAACRENWDEARGGGDEILGIDTSVLLPDPGTWEALQLRQLLSELDAFRDSLAPDLRRSLAGRKEIAAMVFETKRSPWTEAEGLWLADQIDAGLPEAIRSPGGICSIAQQYQHSATAQWRDEIREAVSNLVRDMLWLRQGLGRVNSDAVRRRMRTGLEHDIVPPAEDHDEPTSVREFVTGLVDDPELGGVARLARNLLAVVHFPRRLNEPDDLPLGGVSDITNRGPLDRLLLSELAHDDLTLAVRVAVNEAMYLRRESPPTSRPRTRHILLDSGLCMWGLPRVYGTAAALAMAATADSDTDVLIHRAEGAAIRQVDPLTRAGLQEHLAVLSPELHAGAALVPFAQQHVDDDESECVVITTSDAAAERDFREPLQQIAGSRPVFLLTVERDGRFELAALTARGSKVIRTARLELESILSGPASAASLQDKDITAGLPSIFARDTFPIRLSHSVQPTAVFAACGGTCATTSDGRLMLWTEAGRGAIQLSDQLCRGNPLWQGWDEAGNVLVVFGRLAKDTLRLLLLTEDREVRITELENLANPLRISGFDGQVFVADNRRVQAFVPGRSEPIGETSFNFDVARTTSPSTWLHESPSSRFHQIGGVWLAMAPGVQGPALTEVPCPQRTVRLFDRRGRGVCGLDANGSLWRSWTDKFVGGTKLSNISSVAADGSRVVGIADVGFSRGPSGGRMHLIVLDVDEGTPELAWQRPLDPIKRDLMSRIHDRSLRNRFDGIAVVNGTLYLRAVSGAMLNVVTGDQQRLAVTHETVRSTFIPFEVTPGPPGSRYTLKVASWPDGSRAILDSRCLLHLQSNRAEVPECTLVLAEGELSGWSERDGPFGKSYFVFEEPSRERHAVREIVSRCVDGFTKCL